MFLFDLYIGTVQQFETVISILNPTLQTFYFTTEFLYQSIN